MKMLIVGSRNIEDFDISEYLTADIELVISGGAIGIDSIAEKYADKHGISKLILRPDYARYGKAAPLRRNEVMVELADKILVIWDGHSRGTKYTIDYANKKNKNITVIIK